MKLSFSTRGWPNLSFNEMIEVATDMGFSGIEVYNLAKFDPLMEKGGPFHKHLPGYFRGRASGCNGSKSDRDRARRKGSLRCGVRSA